MNKKKIIIPTVFTIIILLCLIGNPFYTVKPNEYVAIRQFGKIVNVTDTPGLHVKTPFIQSTQHISAATILYDIPASDVITRDKKSMISDNYVLWHVIDARLYAQTLNAIDARAEERIEAAVYNSLKKFISSMTQEEIIAARGNTLDTMVTEDANKDIGIYGIEITESKIKALDLPDDNKAAVFTRMISERENIAASYTAEGDEAAQKIRNDTDKEATIIKAEAEKKAAQLIAEGEAEYMNILQEAYNTTDKADFYNYIRGLDALRVTLKGSNKTLILDKDSELVKIIYGTLD